MNKAVQLLINKLQEFVESGDYAYDGEEGAYFDNEITEQMENAFILAKYELEKPQYGWYGILQTSFPNLKPDWKTGVYATEEEAIEASVEELNKYFATQKSPGWYEDVKDYGKIVRSETRKNFITINAGRHTASLCEVERIQVFGTSSQE